MKRHSLQEIFQYAVERTRNIVIILNKAGQITWVNDSFTKNLVYSFHEVDGHHVSFLFSEDVLFEAVHEQGREARWKDRDGNIIWVHFQQYIPDSTHTLMIANLITKWKNLEALSREQEILINGFSNSFSEINIVVGHNMQVMAFNAFAHRFFMKYLDIALQKGQHLMSGMPNGMKRYLGKQLYLAFNKDKIRKKTYVAQFKKYFVLGFFPISTDGDQVLAVSFHAEDITKEEKYLRKLRQQKNQIQRIAWDNSHAIRKPVANIIGLSDWLGMQAEFDGEVGYMVRKILENSLELDHKIKQLSKQLESFQ